MRSLLAGAILAAGIVSPSLAGPSGFVLVNSTGEAIGDVQIRRAGTQEWRALSGAPKESGARSSVDFADQDCAFDLQASLPGSGPVTWAGVNLCEVKSVVLKRDPEAGAWVDYDE